MAKFTDKQGRDWVIEVTYASVKAVRANASVDLLDIRVGAEGDALSKLDDPITLSEVLLSLCREQVNERKRTDDQFFAAILAVRRIAAKALLEGIADFFQAADTEHLATYLRKIVSALPTMEEQMKEVNDKLAQADIVKALQSDGST